LQSEDVTFEPVAGREFRPKPGEPVKEVKGGRLELAFGVVEVRLHDLLAQTSPPMLSQVQIGQIGRQNDLDEAFSLQSSSQVFVLIISGSVADEVNRVLGLDETACVELRLPGPGGGEGGNGIDPFPTADREKGPFFARVVSHVRCADVVDGLTI
jgi:hypothetical protein